jgi:putative hydrolase of the HAD superfamily
VTAPLSSLDIMKAFPADRLPPASDPREFSHVDTWVFDLDNTLYPHSSRIWPQVDERITLYIANMFGIDGLSARALQKYFYHKHGTTLRALIDEYDIDPYDFLDFAHDIDHAGIELNASLGDAIEKLPGRKLILTNGSRKHAENVARKLGILDRFEDIFDIAAANFVPKPDRRAYETFLEKHGVEPARSAMFEDIAKNLVVPYELGMTTTLIVPQTVDPFREEFEQEAVRTPHIDYVTDDLADFLRECVAR